MSRRLDDLGWYEARERRIIALVNDGRDNVEIGKLEGISYERVRQIRQALGLVSARDHRRISRQGRAKEWAEQKSARAAERRVAYHERRDKMLAAAATGRSAEECWPWPGSRGNKFGHGKIGGVYAHRLAWERANGSVPDGMCICHRCDNPPCVNPSHLFLGTQKDNIRDSVAKGRWRESHLESSRANIRKARIARGQAA